MSNISDLKHKIASENGYESWIDLIHGANAYQLETFIDLLLFQYGLQVRAEQHTKTEFTHIGQDTQDDNHLLSDALSKIIKAHSDVIIVIDSKKNIINTNALHECVPKKMPKKEQIKQNFESPKSKYINNPHRGFKH